MPLNIKDEETHDMARKLAALTGETMTAAVKKSIQERFARLEKTKGREGLADRLDKIAKYCASLPILDDRTPDQIIGYDEYGLPK